jgi:L-seryl-tRNA(Ser) seleniumtransferase
MTPDRSAPSSAEEVRKIPKADRLLGAAESAGFVTRLGHGPVMEEVRGTLDQLRARILGGEPCPPVPEIESDLLARLEANAHGSLRRVVNATGVVIHTNLGRAPLSSQALAAMAEVGAGYSNLEYDLGAGELGDRYGHAAAALCRLTGAEAAAVVNNNAGSVLIALAALCSVRPTPVRPASFDSGAAGASAQDERGGEGGPPEVILSRGQLVEIGGGFRIPDVLRRSGARLVEVGTTNRTYLRDYEGAITERTRMLLSVHRSNFRISGFVHDAELGDLAALGARHGLWVMDDLGSGTLLPTGRFGLGHEPTVPERVASGADLVCFSGDKLLGGPQAGILVGRRAAIELVKRHPLMRALRVDKVTLAGLAATLAHYERGEAEREVPVWRAIAQPLADLEARARRWQAALEGSIGGLAVRESRSAVGGGSLPEVTLPTWVLVLPCRSPDELAGALRRAHPPVVGRIEEGAVVLDPRTVAVDEEPALLSAIRGTHSH